MFICLSPSLAFKKLEKEIIKKFIFTSGSLSSKEEQEEFTGLKFQES